jgi:hypothetical protein
MVAQSVKIRALGSGVYSQSLITNSAYRIQHALGAAAAAGVLGRALIL